MTCFVRWRIFKYVYVTVPLLWLAITLTYRYINRFW